ncbi:MAG TPA: alpha/beta fold hydrolase [Mycobacterium sp.]|nr:alpha/beta fold hydrolase [Mycobacterium sp.]
MEQFRRGELVFDVRDEGPADGPVVVLLHGFPQRNDSWSAVINKLTAQGFRCLAPNQRGYSPGARPPRRRDYRMSELVADVAALIDASGTERVHLVGHDWGAAVAWNVAARLPERLVSVSPISVPHPAAFAKAVLTSRQVLASWYMFFFHLPRVPERLLLRRDGSTTAMAVSLERGGQTPANAASDVAAMSEPGALTAALNWYRAMLMAKAPGKITVPTMYVWSDADDALLDKAAYASGNYVSADYRFETLRGVSHWIPQERPDTVADLLLDWFGSHS